MRDSEQVAEQKHKRRMGGSSRDHHRFSAVPPPPVWPRPDWLILTECSGALGITLWQSLRDVLLWNAVGPASCADLFNPPRPIDRVWLRQSIERSPELGDALYELRVVSESPEVADASPVAAACESVWQRAELRGFRETAIQFAEAAARLEPESSRRSYTAGRLCREAVDYSRAVQWFARATRLARLADPPSEIDFANAHLGWGILEHNQGNFTAAETHFTKAYRAAMRRGRHSLAAAAHHNYVVLLIDAGRPQDAVEHADKAIRLYTSKHPRIPAAACDIAYLWLRLGYFSTAAYIFAKALPWILTPSDQVVVFSMFARAVAANRDRVRYERLSGRALKIIAEGNERSSTAFYHLAEGARSFEQWERVETLASQALGIARKRNEKAVVAAAEHLLGEVASRQIGDLDTVPEEGGIIDQITLKVLRKLRKMPVPESLDPGTVFFPERYPLD